MHRKFHKMYTPSARAFVLPHATHILPHATHPPARHSYPPTRYSRERTLVPRTKQGAQTVLEEVMISAYTYRLIAKIISGAENHCTLPPIK